MDDKPRIINVLVCAIAECFYSAFLTLPVSSSIYSITEKTYTAILNDIKRYKINLSSFLDQKRRRCCIPDLKKLQIKLKTDDIMTSSYKRNTLPEEKLEPGKFFLYDIKSMYVYQQWPVGLVA